MNSTGSFENSEAFRKVEANEKLRGPRKNLIPSTLRGEWKKGFICSLTTLYRVKKVGL